MNYISVNFRTLIFSFLVIVLCGSCSGDGSRPIDEDREEIVFTSTGQVFSPVIVVTGSPKIKWTWADGTVSDSKTPVKDYGTPGVRINKLYINPWSSVVRINIGYDGGDGGSASIEHVADQSVSSVQGLEVVAPYLRQWCSSYNQIASLDFSNFIQLDTIECYISQSLVDVNLANTPALQRACFENCSLANLDVSQSPNLRDLRGALNTYTTINFGTGCNDIWHICIRDNPQITDRYMFVDMSRFPGIEELFIWNDNQTGALNLHSTGTTRTVLIYAHDNQYTTADFTGALQDYSMQGIIYIYRNQLTSINLTGCYQVSNLNARENNLDAAAVDSILLELDYLGRTDGAVDLSINAPPSATGLTYVTNLEGKGWIVNVDE